MDDDAARQDAAILEEKITGLLLRFADSKVASPLPPFTREDAQRWLREHDSGTLGRALVDRCFVKMVWAGVFQVHDRGHFKRAHYTVNTPALRDAQRERVGLAIERKHVAQREQERREAQREQERIEAQQERERQWERFAQEALRSFAEKVALGHTFPFEEALQHVAEHMAARGHEESAPDAESSEARVREILDSMTTNHPSSEGWGPFYKTGDDEYRRLVGGGEPPRETEEGFALEANLRDFLAANLDVLGLGLTLHDGGVEFPAGGGYIDILARDARGGFVVIELKASRGHEYAIGQITRYIAWVQENLAKGEDGEPAKPVRGVILTRRASESLRLAASMVPSVHLLEYALSITVRPTGEG